MGRLRCIYRPELFQGKNRHKNYFEGWYFKCVSPDRRNVLAFIPGVSLGRQAGDGHAFIQVIDAVKNRSDYFNFPLSDFIYAEDRLELHFGENRFSEKGLTVSLKNDRMSYEGSLEFKHPLLLPRSPWNPGIMGPFSFVPWMECYHSVVHADHVLSGNLLIDQARQNFNSGSGYIEKDWGASFPECWVWVQCNSFTRPGASMMLSCARIPFLGRSFPGLISFLYDGKRFTRLSTYQGAHVGNLEFQNGLLELRVEGKHHLLELSVKVEPGGRLKAPKNGTMANTIVESMTSSLEACLKRKDGSILFKDEGSVVGVEMAGELSGLSRKLPGTI